MYSLFKKFLFLFDAEKVHHFSMNMMVMLCKYKPTQRLMQMIFAFRGNQYQKEVAGLTFNNPLGMAAGFDKNAKYLNVFQTLGFGFLEIGTVTPLPQMGNQKPRLFRLIKDKAIINRMGFNNDGAEKIANRLIEYRKKYPVSQKYPMLIGGNIGKNKSTPNEDAWRDYEKCFERLHETVDYFVVNVSSPNTPGLRDLQETESLRKILIHLQQLNTQKPIKRPIFLKISPDLEHSLLEDIIQLAINIQLDGLVVANTTLSRENLKTSAEKLQTYEPGGLSGLPLQNITGMLTRFVCERTNGKLAIISSGGIFTHSDAQQRLDDGADLVQIWTGFIFEGPKIIKNILTNLKN